MILFHYYSTSNHVIDSLVEVNNMDKTVDTMDRNMDRNVDRIVDGRSPSYQWPDTTYVNLSDEPIEREGIRPMNYSSHNGNNSSVGNISIPRPKYYERRQAQHTYTETRLHDNPTEMIERINDEFRFLEERNNNTFQLSANPIGNYNHQPTRSYNKYLFVFFAILQVVVAIGLLVFACYRHFQLFNRKETTSLLDFIKVEDYVSSNLDGTNIISIKLGTSIFLPAFLQIITGFTGLYPLRRRPPKSLYILNVIFAGFSILCWFRPIVYAIFELNLRNIQLQNTINSTSYSLLIILLTVLSFDVLVINSGLLIHANMHLSSSIRTLNHVADIHIAMLAIVFSVLSVSCSAYSTAYTMTNVTEWRQESNNIASLYGFGLRELLISVFLLLIAAINCSAVVTRRKNVRQTALTMQLLGLICLFYELLNEDRLLAASHNIRVMFDKGITDPISPELILLLYTFIVLVTIIMCIQVFSNTMNVFRSPVCDLYTTTTASIQPLSAAHLQSAL